MNTIDQYNFKDKKALIRVDFNVPLDKDFISGQLQDEIPVFY